MLAGEQVRCQRGNGEIREFENRYWNEALTQWAGKKVTIRFDPDYLKGGIKIYDLEDRFICDARCIDAAGFDDVGAAREHNRKRAAYFKALKMQQKMTVELSADELARIYASEPQPAKPKSIPTIPRIVGGNAQAAAQLDDWNEEDDENYSRALRLIGGSDLEI